MRHRRKRSGPSIDQRFISGIGKVDAGKRMIVLLDVEKILSRQEHAQLSEVTVESSGSHKGTVSAQWPKYVS